MPRAKLSGMLLVRRKLRLPAQDLCTTSNDADENARRGPVLVWSAPLKNKAEPETAEDATDAVHRAAGAPQATDLDPPVLGAIAGAASDNAVNSQSSRPGGHAAALRWRAADTGEDLRRTPVVAAVARNAALLCLERLSGAVRVQAETAPAVHSPNAPDDNLLLLDQLVEFAAQRGLNVQPVQFDWQQLQTAAATETVLLLLTNRNVVAVIENGPEGTEEIVISDPLYRGGDAVPVARTALETVWHGDALMVKPLPRKAEPVPAPVTAETGRSNSVSINNVRDRRFGPIICFGLAICGVAAMTAVGFVIFGNTSGQTDPTIALQSNPPSPSVLDAVEMPTNLTTQTHVTNASGIEITTAPAAPVGSEPLPDRLGSVAFGSPGVSLADTAPAAGPAEPGGEPQAALAGTSVPPTDLAPSDAVTPLRLPTRPATTDTLTVPERAPELPPIISAAPTSKQPEPSTEGYAPPPAAGPASAGVPAEEVAALRARGDLLLRGGDITSARLFYERAADAGDANAALQLGETYDQAFLALARTRFIGAWANAAVAAYWYERAHELGAPGADILLAAIAAATAHSSP